MPPALDSHDLITAFVDELVRCGMSDACTSPGSRDTPLLLALARHPRLRAHSHIDERCSGFFGLGIAKATGRPVALTCTSGTAAANLAPAVIEASEARVPLIVLTADRPPELRESGAGQTIDQIKLYGDAVRWFFEVGNHDVTDERIAWVRALACRAYATAAGARPGPVHLNWPLRDPLVPAGARRAHGGRPGGRPWVAVEGPPRRSARLSEHIDAPMRGVIVAGRDDAGLAPEIPQLAIAAGYPLLADPLSGARRGGAAIAHYDLLLRDRGFAGAHTPEVVIRVGDLPTSKPLRTWLASLDGARQVLVDPQFAWQDPSCVVELVLRADPRLLAAPPASDPAWLAAWRDADAAAATAVERTLGDQLSEPNVARTVATALPSEATVFVAASMPVRELESFWPVRDDAPRVLSNRGANGIDGTLSSALGVAAVSERPVVALIGDVAFAHDIGGLLAASRLALSLTIVLINNGGAAVFDYLPIANEQDVYEQHVATATGLDFATAARLYGFRHECPQTLAELRALLAEPVRETLIEVRTDRGAGVALHRRVGSAVSDALAAG
ncbi:MAG: 2-succinyl-5-enolpyruvyl-6-hydroxy-3-cyclohexene-1-carboxylic-acid synthase [Solirubrobacteraceae bacterium]|jgi:2-succinyl-5-enolpyruvyl-6-hydroxy-3-cyclohexene-1-carboxylate synthase